MENNKITIRLSAGDAANIITVANALRINRNPFPTRSGALKMALKLAAEAAVNGTLATARTA